MTGESLDILANNLEQLRALFPQVFTEGKLDLEKFKAIFTDKISIGNERYVLNWAGKADAFRALQVPATGTLLPQPEESVNFDEAENIFIEGENLEVLKLLQKAYYGKIKCIIIDPPYNTGNDSFIYPDSFKESRSDYEKRVGDRDEEGQWLKEGLFRKNSKDSGHFHSNWLSMMYPRLFLARNLLTDDGIIFVHIDDNEVHNLRLLMNEVFGEENFGGTIVWKKKTNGNNMGVIPPVHDYILCYGKQIKEELLRGIALDEDYIQKNYSNPDNDPRGLWTTSDLSANHKGPYFSIKNALTGDEFWPPDGRYWVFNEKEVERRINDGRIIFGKSGKTRPAQKVFLNERKSLRKRVDSWWDKHGMNEDGSAEIARIFVPKVFSHSKPSKTIQHLIDISTVDGDIILDFFAGSGTTAHSVLNINQKELTKRKFILVQLPEKLEIDSDAHKLGMKTIADLAKERIRRVIYNSKEINQQFSFGFKSFKLTDSNFKIWQGNQVDKTNIEAQLQLFTNPLAENTTPLGVVYELMLKAGVPLTAKRTHLSTAHGNWYNIDNELVIAIERASAEMITAILESKPQQVIMLDECFKNNDQLKTNTVLQMRDAGVEFKTI